MSLDIEFTISELCERFQQLDKNVASAKESIHTAGLLVENRIDTHLCIQARSESLNSYREKLLKRTEAEMSSDLRRVNKQPSCQIRCVNTSSYLSSIHLMNEGYFGRILNSERLLTNDMTPSKFVNYLPYLNLANARKTQIKLEYTSFLVGKLHSNDHLESNCVRFEFLLDGNALVTYKIEHQNKTERVLEIINNNAISLYSTRIVQSIGKFFKVKVDCNDNKSIHVLTQLDHGVQEFLFSTYNTRLELVKSFRLIDCIKNDFAKVRHLLANEINDFIFFTFHVFDSELLISLKRRFKDEFYYIIYSMDQECTIKTIIGRFDPLSQKKHCIDNLQVICIGGEVKSLITFSSEYLIFVNDQYQLILMSKTTGQVARRIDLPKRNELDAYFDFKNCQIALADSKSIATKGKKCLMQQNAEFFVHDLNGSLLANSHFDIKILTKFYKTFFKSYFYLGVCTRIYLKYPSLNT